MLKRAPVIYIKIRSRYFSNFNFFLPNRFCLSNLIVKADPVCFVFFNVKSELFRLQNIRTLEIRQVFTFVISNVTQILILTICVMKTVPVWPLKLKNMLRTLALKLFL